MKKIELAKKSRKLFSAILAGAMLTTSVIPESFVWAADVEEVQGFGDSESMGFGSTPDPVTEDGEEGFTDEIASFGSNGSDTPVESGFQSLASAEELQERINALPTVEKFKNLADGTTVEGSTLNQAQTDVYAEAQDIAEKLELLSEDEQGMVDVSRLEELFEYFNGMTEELADTNTISPGNNVTITSGGTYTVQGGTYQPSKSGVITIDTTEKVTLEITGNINMLGCNKGCFISIENACKELTIINKDTVNVDNNIFLCNKNKDATVTFEGGTYEALTNDGVPIIVNGGVVNLKNVKFNATGSVYYGRIVQNYWSDLEGTINIQDGTILDDNNRSGNYPVYPCIDLGTVNMYGGTITSSEGKGNRGIVASNMKVVGGKISNFYNAIDNSAVKNSSTTIGNVTFENNDSDIALVPSSEKNLSYKMTSKELQVFIKIILLNTHI